MKKGFLFFLLLVVYVVQIYGGAWTQKKGSGYFQLSFQTLSSDEFHGANGDKYSFFNLKDNEVSFYGEYGITDDVTMTANIPFYKNLSGSHFLPAPPECNDPGTNCIVFTDESSLNGISDISIGAKIKIAQMSKTVLSASLQLGIPTGESEFEKSLRLGDGEFNQIVKFNIGHSFYPVPSYMSFSIGYNNKTEGYSDQILGSLEGGYSFLGRKLLVMMKIRMLFSIGNGDGTQKGGPNQLFADDQQYIAITPELAYKLTDSIGINASVTTGALAENIISALVFRTGIYFTM